MESFLKRKKAKKGDKVDNVLQVRSPALTVPLHVLVPVVGPEEHLLTERTFEGAMIVSSVGLVMSGDHPDCYHYLMKLCFVFCLS